jgi:hypothetical protein
MCYRTHHHHAALLRNVAPGFLFACFVLAAEAPASKQQEEMYDQRGVDFDFKL